MWILILAIGMGSLLPLQAKMSGELFRATKSATFSGFIAVIGTLILLSALMVGHKQGLYLPKAPWWAYLTGVLGGVYIMGVSYLASQSSVTSIMVGILAGQMLTSLVIDYTATGHVEVKRILAAGFISVAVVLSR